MDHLKGSDILNDIVINNVSKNANGTFASKQMLQKNCTAKKRDRIKGLKLRRFNAYLEGAAVDEAPS